MASKFYAKQVFFAQSLWYNETTVFDPYVQPHEKKRVVNMKHRSATLLLLLLVLCLLMPVWAFSEAAGDTVDILFLGTSDIHGQLYATNYTADISQSGQYARGLTRVATYVEEQRAQYENVFLGDCGDLVQGTPLTYYYAFYQPDAQDPAMKALRMMDYDLFVTGNHEYNYGMDILSRQLADLTAPPPRARTRYGSPWPIIWTRPPTPTKPGTGLPGTATIPTASSTSTG